MKMPKLKVAQLKVDVLPFLKRLRDCGTAAGTARPAQPQSVYAEDFSLLIRAPRRMRIARSIIRVLS